MAVIPNGCAWNHDGYSASIVAPRNYTYVVQWRVETDDRSDGALSVIDGGRLQGPNPLPALYAPYSYGTAPNDESDANAFAMDFRVRRETPSSRYKWLVDVTYRQLQPGETPGDNVDDPLQRPAIWWVEFENTTEELEEGKLLKSLEQTLGPAGAVGTTHRFINAVGDRIVDSVQVPKQYTIYAVEKNYATAKDIADIGAKYANKRNNATWQGFPPKSVLFRSISAGPPRYENGAEYYTATMRFKVDVLQNGEAGHRIKLPHTGMRYTPIAPNLAVLWDFHLGTKLPITQPIFLDFDGSTATPGTTEYIEYEEDNLITFGADLPA